MDIALTLLVAVLAALAAYVLTSMLFKQRLALKDHLLKDKDADIAKLEAKLQAQGEMSAQALNLQIAAVKAELRSEYDQSLKAHEEEIAKKAKETFESISGGIGKDMDKMARAFEENKKAQTETSAELKERIVASIKSLEDQTNRIGERADNLANALKGEKKIQGCFGETILGNILESEGLVEGRDFDREQTIRSSEGVTIVSDMDKRMRPDFVLHYPGGEDIIVDAKTPVNALDDYFAAKTEEDREDAAKRNLEALMNHVKTLSSKDYAAYYRKAGHKTLDYVIMFVPNYGALQLAKQLRPDIWRAAFNDYNVLIATEETFIPFTRMIRTAWVSHEQVRNQNLILESAQRMVDRVHDFAKAHAEMGKKLDEARKYYDQCDDKLKDGGQSIITSARQLLKYGVPANPKKPLPEVVEVEDQSSAESAS